MQSIKKQIQLKNRVDIFILNSRHYYNKSEIKQKRPTDNINLDRNYLSLKIQRSTREYYKINQSMSVVQNQSILLGEFSGLNEENRKLRGEMIEITLGQEKLIEENRRLEEELERKEREVVESRLREKNLQHSLQHVNKLYTSLQQQLNTTLTLTTCTNPLQLRTLYKKQTQLAMDLAFIQRQSYRQVKKSKTHQLQLYQQRIVSLLNQNDKLNKTILLMTSEYNEKICELKRKCEGLEGRLRRIVEVEGRLRGVGDGQRIVASSLSCGGRQSYALSEIAVMQMQLRLQNTKEKLQLYIQQNTELRRRNLSLVQENDILLQQITHFKKREKHNNLQEQLQQDMNNNNSNECNKLSEKDCTIQCMQSVMEENYRLKREVEQVSQRYTLLAETYPRLVQDFDAIRQLEANMHKLSTVKHLQQQLSQSHTLQSTLTQSLNKLQSRYLQELKSRESAQYKCSILTKRFNQIFIKMNPYFNIYQYQALDLNQEEFIFFSANKDYKQLKEYEREVGQLRRELKEEGYWREKEGVEWGDRLVKKETELTKLKQQFNSLQSQFNNLNTTNKQLTQQLHNYQLLNIDPNLLNQNVNQHKLNNEKMVDKLQLEREHLLQAIYQKDEKIVELARELREAVMRQQVVESVQVKEQKYKDIREERLSGMARNTGYEQLNLLIAKNQELQQKYDSTVQQLTTFIHNLQSQLSSQHDIYQAQTKQYQEEYTKQFIEMKEMIEKWKENCGRFKVLFLESKGKERESEGERVNLEEKQQANDRDENLSLQNPKETHPSQPQPQVSNNLPAHQHPQLLAQQSMVLDVTAPHLLLGQQGNNNKLTGQSTVQNLTTMLKKYEQQMNEVLTMCAKLTQQYNQLKQQIQRQQQLQYTNATLTVTCNNLTEQLAQVKRVLQQKNRSLQTTSALYDQRQVQFQQMQSRISAQSKLSQSIIEQERHKNHLLSKQLSQIKQKLYSQLTLSSSEGVNIDQQIMSKSEFETIVVMHANKNKQISHLVETNKVLESKVDTLMKQLNHIQQQSTNKKAEEISPLERSEIRQLNLLLKSTNLLDLVKRANEIIQKQQRIQLEQKEEQQQRNVQKENEMVEQGELREQRDQEVQDKDRSVQY